jgi:hypothetical protein
MISRRGHILLGVVLVGGVVALAKACDVESQRSIAESHAFLDAQVAECRAAGGVPIYRRGDNAIRDCAFAPRR